MTTISAPTRDHAGDRQELGHPRLRQLGIDTRYVLVGFPLAIITFAVLLTTFVLGVSTLFIVVGLPITVGALYIARMFAFAERARIPGVLREPLVPATYKQAAPDAGPWRKMLTPMTDGQSWLDLLHGIVRFPVAIATFVIIVTWWSIAIAGVLYPLYGWSIPYGPEYRDLVDLMGYQSTTGTRTTFNVIVGAVFAVTLPFVVRGCALAEAGIARAMLTALPRLRAEMAGLTTQAHTAQRRTAAAVSAEAVALRKLERDIHDGPQQRLVRLAVDLGRAQHQLDSDPAAARATMDEALAQARETLAELRTLSRGIAPPILTDRGLAAATAALAARATAPVELDIAELDRLAPLAEQTAYFVIAEALANMAKHSGATTARVAVRQSGDTLEVTVSDNGRGGAHLAKGHGLAGLADRLHAAGGELWVSSPEGGPTKIRAEIPVSAPNGMGAPTG